MYDKEKFMKVAIQLARDNLKNNNGGPFGAVVVKAGKIIGKGVNTVTSGMDPTAHAEINAIREACNNLGNYQLNGCDIYSSCEPCPMCLGAIYWSRPDKIYYAASKNDAAVAGFDDSEIYKEIKLPAGLRKIPSEQLLKQEAKEIFDIWINLDNKTDY